MSNTAVDMSGYENDGIVVIRRVESSNNGYAKWECKCKLCGKIFVTKGSSIRTNSVKSCGCSHSLNEIAITKLLTDNNIEFKREFTFPDLVGCNGGRLRFDFAIFKNGELSHLIEYNGLQHYKKTKGKWGKGYEERVLHDKRKIEYCERHNIRLIIIDYNKDYSIDDLL